MLKNYFLVAFRQVLRNKVFTLVNIGGLSIGISVCIAIMLFIRFEQSHDNFHQDLERIYRVNATLKLPDQTIKIAGAISQMSLRLQKDVTGFEQVAPFHIIYLNKIVLHEGHQKTKVLSASDNKKVIVTRPSYMHIFQYKWLAGSPETSLEKPFQVVLLESKAKAYYPNLKATEVVGKRILYINDQDSVAVTVSGIVKDWAGNTDLNFTDFISFTTLEHKWKYNLSDWNNINGSSQLFVKINKGESATKIAKKITKYIEKNSSEKDSKFLFEALLQPINDIHYNAELRTDYGRTINPAFMQVLAGIAGLLLLIACINFINLATAQATQRAKEVGIRKAMGSTRIQLMVQFLSETFIIVSLSVLLALVFTETWILGLETFVIEDVKIKSNIGDMLLFTLLTIIITTGLAGFYPSFVLSRYNPVQTLRNQVIRGTSRKAYMRKVLIIFQFTASQVFMMLLTILYFQLDFMRSKDIGFNKDNVLYFSVPWTEENQKKDALFATLKRIPEVEKISLSGAPPSSVQSSSSTVSYIKDKHKIEYTVYQKYTDDQYIDFYNLRLLAGKTLAKRDSSTEIVVNETFVRNFRLGTPKEAVGKLVTWNDLKYPIVGVVADFHVKSLHEAIPNVLLASNRYTHTFHIKAKHKKVIEKAKKAWQMYYPDLPFEYQYLDESIHKFYKKESNFSVLLSFSMCLAIFISCIGLLGLVIFTTNQRNKEIGIRKIHGASIQQIIFLLSKDFLRLILIAFVGATFLAYYIGTRWLENYAYRIEVSWWMFALSGALACFIALFTVSFQALKAAKRNPVDSLRME